MNACLAFYVIPCKVGIHNGCLLISPGCDLGTRKGTDSRAMGGFAVSDLSLGSGLLAAENMAATSDRVSFMARIQQKTSQR